MGIKWRRIDKKCYSTSLAQSIVGGMLLWPPVHIVASNTFGFSTWRLFGWGMYATPSPEDTSNLRVVFFEDSIEAAAENVHQVYDHLQQLSRSQEERSCITIFFKPTQQSIRKIPLSGLCRETSVINDLDYFLHFSSAPHLASLVQRAGGQAKLPAAAALGFLSKQRLDIKNRHAYVEFDAYRLSGPHATYLGRFRRG